MIVRYLLISRRLFSTRHFPPFNLNKGFEYLTKSKKYEGLSSAADLSHHRDELLRSFESSRFDALKFDLDLPSRLALCDALRYEIFHLADPTSSSAVEEEDSDENDKTEKLNEFKSYSHDNRKFKYFLRSFLRSSLLQSIARNAHDWPEFLNSLSPKWYLKLLFYYGFYHYHEELAEEEIRFLESYPSSPVSSQYDYDMFELTTLSGCFFKLNLRMDRPFFDRYMNAFYALSPSDQLTFFYSAVKLVRQQQYLDEKFVALMKTMLRDHHEVLPFISAVNVASAFAVLGHYDAESLQLIGQIAHKSTFRRFKDITKLIWAFSFLGYDFQSDQKLFGSLIEHLKRLNNQGYKFSYEHGVKDSIDLLKSLICLNIYDFELIDLLLNDRSINSTMRTGTMKIRNDLYFILKSLQIEHPNFQLTNRPLYQLAEKPGQNLKRELQVRTDYPDFIEFYRNRLRSVAQFSYEIVYPLSHMNLTSIRVRYVDENGRRTSVLLDLLDSSNTLSNQPDHIKSIYKTKLRQMTAEGYNFVLFRRIGDGNYVQVDRYENH